MGTMGFVQASFLGGVWSQTAQGDVIDPRYKISMNVCQNGYPVEPGAWTRRPGIAHAGYTLGGAPARLFRFDFEEAFPYVLEFTDTRFVPWTSTGAGLVPATTNAGAPGWPISAVSTASPAEVTLSVASTLASGNHAFVTGVPGLAGRSLVVTEIDTTHYTLVDQVTGANINGTYLGTPLASAMIYQRQNKVHPYASQAWKNMRLVQTNSAAFTLHNQFPPYQITVTSQPSSTNFAQFAISQSTFLDGPYLDPFVNGQNVTASAVSGIVTLTAGLPAYSSTQAYKAGDLVVSSSVGYVSLQDDNVNNTPASSASYWSVVSLGYGINSGQGFIASDVGRLVRLFSEPAVWVAGTTYATGNVISYNPSGVPGGNTYWQSLVSSNTGNVPGADITHWELLAIGSTANPALWTWGKILGLSATGQISGSLSGSTNIGTMTSEGGVAAAFDGNTAKASASCAVYNFGNNTGSADTYVGKNYTGASAQTISQAVVYPSTDAGFSTPSSGSTFTFNLRASNSSPGSPSAGTLLGTATALANSLAPLTITSSDTSDTWNYVWVEVVTPNLFDLDWVIIAQVVFYSASAAPGTAVSVEILGPPLRYSGIVVNAWRLGVYSNTTTWPSVGTYSDGRLWLTGAVSNRIDACYANGIIGTTVNFAPTDQYGNVTAANAFSYVFNAPDVNPIYWMIPDLQGVIAGTLAGEWLVVAPTTGGISPLNIAARRVTKIRCANIEPRRTEHTIVFVQAYQRKLMEYFPDVFSGKFTAPNLAEKWKHLTYPGIAEIAYQQELVPIVWMRLNNGGLIGMTYKRDTLMTSTGPTFNAAHSHVLGSGNTVTSIVAGPSENGNLDALCMVTYDGTYYHVEQLTDLFEEGDTLQNANFLDMSMVSPAYNVGYALGGANGINVYDLAYLEGQTATVFAGGLDVGDWPVTNGILSVPFYPSTNQTNPLFTAAFASAFSGAMPLVVGFCPTAQGQLLNPVSLQDSGSRQGTGFGKKQRMSAVRARLVNTQGLYIGMGLTPGTATYVRQAQLKTPGGGSLLAANVLFTGIYWDSINDDAQSRQSQIAWQIVRPFPVTVAAIGGTVETVDE